MEDCSVPSRLSFVESPEAPSLCISKDRFRHNDLLYWFHESLHNKCPSRVLSQHDSRLFWQPQRVFCLCNEYWTMLRSRMRDVDKALRLRNSLSTFLLSFFLFLIDDSPKHNVSYRC